MTERQILVAANWKMNGTLEAIRPLVDAIIRGVQGISNEVAICPPSVYISELTTLLNGSEIRLGAQNVSHLEKGAFTGEISISMLSDFACQYVIVGHSERRALYAETDVLVAEKFKAVQSGGMTSILCVGELLEERESNDTEKVIARQIDAVIEKAGIEAFKNAVIAYEPVWAIGTGKTATPEQAQEVHEFIRLRLARHDNQTADNVRILYGGSVKADNAEQLFKMADIDGGLIGGASLVAEDFLTICKAMR
ncbi:MAG: triose-phosphate isomerase [Proteobacteria bacterium]|nr:triose-phosphate isomerase [Pseudomonadota bacterium]NOG59613.1 triose-phosphate isomerase [Pseudomonadota bacterium]